MWKPPAAPRLSGSNLRSNLTLLGFAASAGTPLEHLAGAAAAALSRFLIRKVQVLRILAPVLPSSRLLSDGPANGRLRMEALIVESAIPVREADEAIVFSKLTSLSRDSKVTAAFARSLRTEMNSRGLTAPARLQVVVSDPTVAAPAPATPMLGQAPGGSGASATLSMNSAIVIICVACLITSCACALLALFWWQNKCRRGSRPTSKNTCHTHSPQPPPAKGSWAKTVDADLKEANQGKDISVFLDGTQDVSGKIHEMNEVNVISGLPIHEMKEVEVISGFPKVNI
jgi:hypothetical protein